MISTEQTSVPYLNGPLPMSFVPNILNPNNQFYYSQTFNDYNYEKISQLDMPNNIPTNFPRSPFRNYPNNSENENTLNNNLNSNYLSPEKPYNYRFNYQNNFQNNFNYDGNFLNNKGNSINTISTISSSFLPKNQKDISKSLQYFSPQKQNEKNNNLSQSISSSDTFYKKTNNKLFNQLSNSYQISNTINPNLPDYAVFELDEDESVNYDFGVSIPKETHACQTSPFVIRINPFSVNRKRRNCKSVAKRKLINFTSSKNSEPLDSIKRDKNSVKNIKKIKMIQPVKTLNVINEKEKNISVNNNKNIEIKNLQPVKNLNKNYNGNAKNITNNLKNNSSNNNKEKMTKEKYNNIFTSIKNMFQETFFIDNIDVFHSNKFNNELKYPKPSNNNINNKNILKKETKDNTKIKASKIEKISSPKKETKKEINKLSEIINSPKPPINKSVNTTNNNELTDNIPEKFDPNEFQIIKQIGEGEYGKIYIVKWVKNNQQYAMKIETTEDRDELFWSQSKIKIMKDFYNKTKHNGIIRIFGDLWKKDLTDYEYYIIMELAEKDWEQEIYLRYQYQEYYTEKELVNILGQIITTCALLQKNHISHRDIKPQNILLKNGLYKLSDFGEAKILTKNGTIIQKIRGTEMFMSPVLFFGLHDGEKPAEKISHNTYKSDVYSLGMCALFAATLNFDCPCDIRELKNMNKVEEIVNKGLSKRYSSNFISFILEMLEIDEIHRPDFIQLEQQMFKK